MQQVVHVYTDLSSEHIYFVVIISKYDFHSSKFNIDSSIFHRLTHTLFIFIKCIPHITTKNCAFPYSSIDLLREHSRIFYCFGYQSHYYERVITKTKNYTLYHYGHYRGYMSALLQFIGEISASKVLENNNFERTAMENSI